MLHLPAMSTGKIIIALLGLLVVAQPINLPPQNKNMEVVEMSLSDFCREWWTHTSPQDWENVTVEDIKNDLENLENHVPWSAEEVYQEIKSIVLEYKILNAEGRLIFDNNGGVTVQLPGYAHYYDVPEDAAGDVANYINSGNTDNWEGHEDDAAELDPDAETIRNGGYRVFSISDLNNLRYIGNWGSVEDFCTELFKLVK